MPWIPMRVLTNTIRVAAVVIGIFSSVEFAYAVSILVVSVGEVLGLWPQEPNDPQQGAVASNNETILKASSVPEASLIELPPQNYKDFENHNETLLFDLKEFVVNNGLAMIFLIMMCVLSSLEMYFNYALYKGATKGEVRGCKIWLKGCSILLIVHTSFIVWDAVESFMYGECALEYFNARRICRFIWIILCSTTILLTDSLLTGKRRLRKSKIMLPKQRLNAGLVPHSNWDWEGPIVIVNGNGDMDIEEGDSPHAIRHLVTHF